MKFSKNSRSRTDSRTNTSTVVLRSFDLDDDRPGEHMMTDCSDTEICETVASFSRRQGVTRNPLHPNEEDPFDSHDQRLTRGRRVVQEDRMWLRPSDRQGIHRRTAERDSDHGWHRCKRPGVAVSDLDEISCKLVTQTLFSFVQAVFFFCQRFDDGGEAPCGDSDSPGSEQPRGIDKTMHRIFNFHFIVSSMKKRRLRSDHVFCIHC